MRRVVLVFVGALLVAGMAGAQHYEAFLITEDGLRVGTVELWCDGVHLNVLAVPDAGFLLAEINIYVGLDPVPISANGNPLFQRFNLCWKGPATSDPYGIEVHISELGIPPGEGADLYIASHCRIVTTERPPWTVIAWAEGPYSFAGPVWGMWDVFSVVPPP